MEQQAIQAEIVARDVSFEEYMEKYAEHFTEWVEGTVIKLSPVTIIHDKLSRFLITLLMFYLNRSKEGVVKAAPFVMRTRTGLPGREPDLHIVLNDRLNIIKETITEGPADVVIEIVSKEIRGRDTLEKFDEYQDAGVREYWLIDPIRKLPDFYSLDENGEYMRIELNKGIFRSRVLSHFRIDTRIFWQTETLEDVGQIQAIVEAMFTEDAS